MSCISVSRTSGVVLLSSSSLSRIYMGDAGLSPTLFWFSGVGVVFRFSMGCWACVVAARSGVGRFVNLSKIFILSTG